MTSTQWEPGVTLFWKINIIAIAHVTKTNMAYDDSRHFQKYFSYIVVVSSIGVETGVPRENHRPVASHWQTLSHHVISSTPRQLLVVIGTYCTEACKSTDYHTITATTAIQNKTKYENSLLLLLRNEIYTDTGEQNKTKYEKT